MIYITGDIHANPKRLGMNALAQRGIHMNPEDYIIICGDFGIPWVGESDETDHKWLEWLAQLSYTVLFVDGNHENFDQLCRYPVKNWSGGRVHELRPNLYHCCAAKSLPSKARPFSPSAAPSRQTRPSAGLASPGGPRKRHRQTTSTMPPRT